MFIVDISSIKLDEVLNNKVSKIKINTNKTNMKFKISLNKSNIIDFKTIIKRHF